VRWNGESSILEEQMLALMCNLPFKNCMRDLQITRVIVEQRDLSLCLLEEAAACARMPRRDTSAWPAN
jgi:hypothetical protein